MRFIERKKKMDYLLESIEKGRVRSLENVAEKFECSTRTIKRLLSDLREDGHSVRYDKKNKKFLSD
jgi:biotin operon repressor